MLYELFFIIMSLLVAITPKIGIFIFWGMVAFNSCCQGLCHELVLPVLHFSHQNFPQIKLVDVYFFLDATQKVKNSGVVAPECIVECIVIDLNTVGSLLKQFKPSFSFCLSLFRLGEAFRPLRT